MAKTNISFNNKEYQIDESVLSTASSALKSHFSTVMNGSGATINLDGTAYSIDSGKLATATNAFISHLGTVSGNGYKVKVGGVEYGVGTDKMTGAVAELEAVLGGLNSGGDKPDTDDKILAYLLDPCSLEFYDSGMAMVPSSMSHDIADGESCYIEIDGNAYACVCSITTSTNMVGTVITNVEFNPVGEHTVRYTYNSMVNIGQIFVSTEEVGVGFHEVAIYKLL